MKLLFWNSFASLVLISCGALSTIKSSRENYLALEYLVANPIHFTDDEALQDILSEIQDRCPTNTRLAKSVDQKYNKCLTSQLASKEITNAVRKIDKAIGKGKPVMEETSSAICVLISWTHSCLREVKSLASKCAPGATKAIKKSEKVVGYLCGDRDEGKVLSLMISDSVNQCFEDNFSEMQKCFNIGMDLSLTMSEDSCRDVRRMHKCTLNTLLACNDPSTYNLFDTLNQVIQEAIGCTEPDNDNGNTQLSLSSASNTGGSLVFFMISMLPLFRHF